MLTDAASEAITKACAFVYPLNNILIRKVKMLKKPKLDSTKLNDLFIIVFSNIKLWVYIMNFISYRTSFNYYV